MFAGFVMTMPIVEQRRTEADWVSRFADEVIAAADRRALGRPIVVASGLSPSGPIHLGNLREVMTPHLVADEIRRRGVGCMHILSWDDYDRFRRFPADVDPSWSKHIGKPLTSVPAPKGSRYASWAEHFKAPMVEALAQLGVEFQEVSQTERYTSGAYREQILLAMRKRERIGQVLDRYRTKVKAGAEREDRSDEASRADLGAGEDDEGSGARREKDGVGAADYFPYKPYCSACERDLTTVTGYDDETADMAYTCMCGHAETVNLSEHSRGKLVWKVDWPMRWAYEDVLFEPSGVDHQSPGSSYVVGTQLVRDVFGGEPPIGPMYAFVGFAGMAKMSSSKGGVPTPADALEIMEPQLLRWLYARRRPQQSFTITFDEEIHRLYDEWDAVGRNVADGTATGATATAYDRATGTAAGWLPATPHPLPYRTLVSVIDISAGDPEQILRILGDLDPDSPLGGLDEVRPRLDRAQTWVTTQMAANQRTRVRDEPDVQLIASLTKAESESLRLLLDGLDEHWSLEGLTTLVYAVPKVQAGLPPDAGPTTELKTLQRAFFALLYKLLVGRDTGPRLPTLLLAVGPARVRTLLGSRR
ncbi:MAG: lysine--tRNA ligase [Candidatus Dormibacteria bacterium]